MAACSAATPHNSLLSEEKGDHTLPESTPKSLLISLRNKLAKKKHPVEVIARFKPTSVCGSNGKEEVKSNDMIEVTNDAGVVVLKFEGKERSYQMDGTSLASEEWTPTFYQKHIFQKVEDVRFGGTCTVLMYGPTGSGKSYTMFGTSKEKGIVVMALEQLTGNLGQKNNESGSDVGKSVCSEESEVDSKAGRKESGTSLKHLVRVKIIEIEGEKMYDLIAKPTTSPFSFKKVGFQKLLCFTLIRLRSSLLSGKWR